MTPTKLLIGQILVVFAIVKAAGIEYAARGIRVNAVARGIIDTSMVAGMKQAEEGVIENMMRDVTIKRLGGGRRRDAVAVQRRCELRRRPCIAIDGGYVAR